MQATDLVCHRNLFAACLVGLPFGLSTLTTYGVIRGPPGCPVFSELVVSRSLRLVW